jgi:23S rRNA pseudouridine2605 synthase
MTDDTEAGERIAKRIARAGVCSRRDAERLIEAGRIAVDGTVLTSPALVVTAGQIVTLDGKPIDAPAPARLWRYHKPKGVMTTHKDPEGRTTLFDSLPKDLPRVISVGRLDFNSEGLILLTNDGGLARKMELPSSGWLRRYRVRLNGIILEADLEKIADGIVIDGEQYGPIQASIDRRQGANTWLTMSLREGKNREIRRVVEHLGGVVNRLIRVAYGPFQLGYLEPGGIEEVPAKVLRDQLGTGEPKPRLRSAGKLGTAKQKPAPAPEAKASEKAAPEKSGSEKSGPRKSASDRSGPGKPAARKPDFRKAGSGRPGSGKPGSGKPGSGKPGPGKPGGKLADRRR